MRHLIRLLLYLCPLLAHPLSHADTISEWHQIALDTIVESEQRPYQRLRAIAMVNLAMFEAVNFVQGRYRPRFVVGSPGMQGVSPEAAAAAAAHHVLSNLYPNREAALDAALDESLDALPANQAKASGVVTGASLAAIVRTVALHDVAAEEPSDEVIASAWPPVVRRQLWMPDPVGWSPVLTELIAMQSRAPYERARLHALASIIAAESYLVAAQIRERCAACVAVASVAHVLASELGLAGIEAGKTDPDRELGRALAHAALRQYYRPVGAP